MKTSRYRLAIIVPLVLSFGLTVGCQKKAPAGITEAEAKAIGDIYVRARNEANLDLLNDIMAPDVVVHDTGYPENIVGLDALKKQYAATHAAVPDVKFSLDEMYVKGDKVVWVFTMTGTITGPFRLPMGELPPTGRSILVTGAAIDKVADGKIVEEWVFYNPLGILVPAGFTLTPPSAPPAEN
jgi:predicted ester cyclase